MHACMHAGSSSAGNKRKRKKKKKKKISLRLVGVACRGAKGPPSRACAEIDNSHILFTGKPVCTV